MKKIQFTAAIFMLALASSCSKTDEMTDVEVNTPNVDGEIYVINATSEGSATRTALGGEGGLDIFWQKGDAMNLYVKDVTYDEATSKYTITANDTTTGTKLSTEDSGATTAEFATEDSSAIPTVDDATGTVTYFALTPYQDNNTGSGVSGGSEIKIQNVSSTNYVAIYFLMPATQKYVADSYDPSVAFAYAKTDDISSGLSFDNLFGVLRLNLIGAEGQYVTSVTVTAASGNLTGFVNAYTAADMEANSTTYKLSAGGNDAAATITMDCSAENDGEGVALSDTATPFNIALLPVTSDLTVAITYKVDGVETTKSYTTSADITRSGLTNMNDLNINPTAPQGNSTESLTKSEGGDLTEVLTPVA